jgi:hypothetical protein
MKPIAGPLMKPWTNAPAPLALDFGAARRRPGWMGWVALAMGATAVLGAGFEAWSAYVDVAERAAIVDRLRAQARAGTSAPTSKGGPSLARSAAYDAGPAFAVAMQLNADWAGVFAAVARSRGAEVTVLELHADAARGSLRIVAEVPTVDEAFAYLERLQGEDAVRAATLDSHAWVDDEATSVVRFNASARWGMPQ